MIKASQVRQEYQHLVPEKLNYLIPKIEYVSKKADFKKAKIKIFFLQKSYSKNSPKRGIGLSSISKWADFLNAKNKTTIYNLYIGNQATTK